MQGGDIIGGVSFERLESALAERVRDAINDPLSALWILAPTNLLALHLRRRVALECGGVVAARFLTIEDIALELAHRGLACRALRPVPAGADLIILGKILDGRPQGSYFAELRHFGNSPAAVARELQVLRHALWTPERLKAAAERLQTRSADTGTRLRELAEIWASFQQWKREQKLYDDEDLLWSAAEPGPSDVGSPSRLLIYGYYDFTPLQARLVRRIVSLSGAATAFLLWGERESAPAPGFEYAEPAIAFLKEILNSKGVECLDDGPTETDLDKLRRGLFVDYPPPTPQVDDEAAKAAEQSRDGSVKVLSCPGRFPEAVEAVREVVRAFALSGRRTEAGILLRSAEGTAELLREAADQAGLQCFIHEGLPLKNTVPGRVLLNMLELAEGDSARSDVVSFLALADIQWPQGLSSVAIDRLSAAAGIIRGRKQWKAKLEARAEALCAKKEGAETSEEADALQLEAELCRSAVGFLDGFFAQVAEVSAAESWAQMAQRLRSLFLSYTGPQHAGRREVSDVLTRMGELDVTGRAPDVAAARAHLGRRLRQQSLSLQNFKRCGLSVSSLMRCRGATFGLVILPGLTEKAFPMQIRQGPLLSELDREALNGQSKELGCGELPLQARRTLEERYLFRVALGSARDCAVLSYARIGDDTGRPNTPSRFLLQACEALTGFAVDAEAMESYLPPTLFKRIRLGRDLAGEGELELALDPWEYDLAVYRSGGDEAERREYTGRISEFFSRAAVLEERRWSEAAFGPYDGLISQPDLLESLSEKYARFDAAVSPSRLETYALCPFSYYLKYVLGLEEQEEPTEEYRIPPPDWGRLMHALLRRVYSARLAGRPLGELDDVKLREVMAFAAGAVDELGRVYAQGMPALWVAERERALAQLQRLLRFEAQKNPDALPERFEFSFGFPGLPRAYRVAVDGDRTVGFRGRVDRIDSLPDGSIQVIDYKTGKSNGYAERSFRGGTQLQMPIYLLSASQALQKEHGTARYLFVGERSWKEQLSLAGLRERMDEFMEVLRLILEGISSGEFFPVPHKRKLSFCERNCECRSVCGAARAKIPEMKAADRALSRLNRLRGIT